MDNLVNPGIVPVQGKPYRLGVALSGGGSRGLAHAGALKALEEEGLKPDILAGVSAGSAVAVLYAAGVSPDRILELFLDRKFSDLAEFHIGKNGFLRIDRFSKFITSNLGGIRLMEDLKIPTFIGVTNFDKGTAEEFHTGEIEPLVRASCSIPIAVQPAVIGHTTYVDGGVLRNLPSWIIRDKCDQLIGVNVSPLVNVNEKQSLFGIAMRAYTLMSKANQNRDMEMCDLVVRTREIASHKVFSLKELAEVFDAGYRNMKKALAEASPALRSA